MEHLWTELKIPFDLAKLDRIWIQEFSGEQSESEIYFPIESDALLISVCMNLYDRRDTFQ